MKRVTGLGGIFFKSENQAQSIEWYKKHLGLDINESYGGTEFKWRDHENPEKESKTIWSVFKSTTKYLDPSQSKFMVNYIVEDLETLMPILKSEGVEVVGDLEKSDYGKFAWILDPDGNKIELWEPGK